MNPEQRNIRLPFHQTAEQRARMDAVNSAALALGMLVAKMRARKAGR